MLDHAFQTYMHTQVMRWVLVGMIGCFTGIIAFLIDTGVRYLFELKFILFDKGKFNALTRQYYSYMASTVLQYTMPL